MSQREAKYYEPSGKFSPRLPGGLLGYVLIVPPCLALIYAYGQVFFGDSGFNGIFHLTNPALAMGGSFLLSWLTKRFVVERNHVRNAKLAGWLGLLVGLEFLWLQWLCWVLFYAGEGGVFNAMHLLVHPLQLGERIFQINGVGTWAFTMDENDIRMRLDGAWLWIPWAIEALLLTLMPMNACSARASAPYSESKSAWFKRLELPELFSPTGAQSVVSALLKGREDAFTGVGEAEFVLDDDKDTEVQKLVKDKKVEAGLKNNFELILYTLDGEKSYVTVNTALLDNSRGVVFEPSLTLLQVSDATTRAILEISARSERRFKALREEARRKR